MYITKTNMADNHISKAAVIWEGGCYVLWASWYTLAALRNFVLGFWLALNKTTPTVGRLVFLPVLYLTNFMINCNFLELKTCILNWQRSNVSLGAQFKQDPMSFVTCHELYQYLTFNSGTMYPTFPIMQPILILGVSLPGKRPHLTKFHNPRFTMQAFCLPKICSLDDVMRVIFWDFLQSHSRHYSTVFRGWLVLPETTKLMFFLHNFSRTSPFMMIMMVTTK